MSDRPIGATAGVIIAILLVLTACKFAQAVLEPAVFAIFIIMIAWPMQRKLQSENR